MPPQKPADRTPERSETLARGAPTTPLPPASRAPAAVVRGAQPSTDPLTEVEVAELLALEAEANPERMPSGHAAQATTRLLLDRARAEGWTSATLRALWLEPWTYKLRGRTWSTLFAGGWTPKRTTLLERLRTAAKRPAAPSYDDMTPDEIDALQLRLARERAERFDREEREDDERRSRELRLAAK